MNALDDAESMIATEDVKPDVVFFDMPGTLRSNGVIKTLSQMDYIFTPLSADRFVVESTLKSVSYTHLDVYKRQRLSSPIALYLRLGESQSCLSTPDVFFPSLMFVKSFIFNCHTSIF